MPGASYADLSEVIDDAVRPWLDRADVKDERLTELQRAWRERGFVVLPGLIPDELIEQYCKRFTAYHDVSGFQTPTPYEHISEVRAISLYEPFRDVINSLIGDEMILHLNLTHWISTQRNWHQDDYLNGPEVNGWYLGMGRARRRRCRRRALRVHPGSHRWPVLRRDRVMALMTPQQFEADRENPNSIWAIFTQDEVAEAVEERRVAERLPIESFLGRRGDVLIWHACLQHRGSVPEVRPQDRWRPWNAKYPPRKALISHYTATSHIETGGWPVVEDDHGGKYVRYELTLDHFHGSEARRLSRRIKKRIEWATRVR